MFNFFKKSSSKASSLLQEEKQNSRAQFFELEVEDITRETEDCVSVAFKIPEDLSKEYRFIPGQYLTLEAVIDGENVRRSYSLCSSPLDGELRVAIKKVDQGKFSTWANTKLKVGDRVKVMTPMGNFTHSPKEDQKEHYVAFAAGSGITPVFSIIKSVLEAEPDSKVSLFYGNKTAKTIIFKEQLEALKNEYLNRLELHYVLSREDQGTDYLKGRIDAKKCQHYAEHFFDIESSKAFFLCGPEAMIHEVSDTLQKLGAPKEKIHFELFTSPSSSLEGKKTVSANKDDNEAEKLSDVTVILDGEETHLKLKRGGASILDAALDAGADVPYACKGAVCCTCRAKVMEGSAEMDMNYALEDDEVQDGFVLTCQSHPTSEKVVVSFDE